MIRWMGLLAPTYILAPVDFVAEWGGAGRSHHPGFENDHEWILDGRIFEPVELISDLSSYCMLFAEDDADLAVISHGPSTYDIVRMVTCESSEDEAVDEEVLRAVQAENARPFESSLRFATKGETFTFFPTPLIHEDLGSETFSSDVAELEFTLGRYGVQSRDVETEDLHILIHQIRHISELRP